MYNIDVEIKEFTDKKYIPINDLMSLGKDFIDKTLEYRRKFMEMIAINDLDFVNIVETPALIKKRYRKNVDLKGVIDSHPRNNDYILEMAIKIVNGEEIKGIDIPSSKEILKKYNDNGKDLTIITNYLIANIDKLISNTVASGDDITLLFPELTSKDIQFIQTNNNINLNYSMTDYQKSTGCSYETARSGLERLVKLKLFKKKKIGKKFVYSPTHKIANTSLGGHHAN